MTWITCIPFFYFFQISGEKEVILFEPHNDFLYEAHIPEAILSYNATLKQFRRSTLLDSTSMVMTPVDILQPHLEVCACVCVCARVCSHLLLNFAISCLKVCTLFVVGVK